MWYWYEERPNELLLDLDNAEPRRIMAFAGRLCGATNGGKLPVRRYFMTPSGGERGLHMVLLLERPLPWPEKAAWSLYLLSDRHRVAMGLMRHSYRHEWPTVLMEREPVPVQVWREADAVCECGGKHGAGAMLTCPVGQSLGRWETGDYFGSPDPDNWRNTILDGVLRRAEA